MLSLTHAQLQWIFLNYQADQKEEQDKLKLLAYIIDPIRAKAVFEPKSEQEVVVASQDWFLEEVKRQSKMSGEQVEELLKTDPNALNDPNFTVIERAR